MYKHNIFFWNIYMRVCVLYIHNKYTHIMQTKTLILDAINHDWSFDSTNFIK